ncbi:MAG: glycosyltransferase [Rhodospirillaceae bacterium]|nr:glycosyltransferase [Rhodospirillaceae bacterium]
MRLLHTIAGGRHGGAERFFVDLVTALSDRGVEQHAITRPYPGRVHQLVQFGCGVTEVRMGGPLDFWSKSRIKHASSDFAPDINLAWMNRAARYAASGAWINIGRLGGYYDLKYYQSCDHLICNTPDLVRHCVDSGWPEGRVDYIPNFAPAPDSTPVSRGSLRTPDGAAVLLVLARLEETKAIDVAINALVHLPESFLWIAGEGSCNDALRALAEALGVADRVRFLGWRDDRENLLAAADICLVPSRHEPFGNVIVNAWVAGTPIVAAASEGPNFLIDSEANGVLVPVDDPVAMAAAVCTLLTDASFLQRQVSGGQSSIVESFSENSVVSAYIRLFEWLIERTSREDALRGPPLSRFGA